MNETATNEMIITAKTVEEALARACAELGAPSVDALTYTVLEEPKRGLFGLGAAPAACRKRLSVGAIMDRPRILPKQNPSP